MTVTLAQYADVLLHTVNASDGDTLKDLFTFRFFQNQNFQSTQEHVTLTDEVIKSVHDISQQRIQTALLKCSGILTSPWLEIATHHFIAATRLARLQTNFDPNYISRASPDSLLDRQGLTVRKAIVESWQAMHSLVIAFLRHFSSLQQGRWCVKSLVLILSNYRTLSVMADEIESKGDKITNGNKQRKQSHLEECARQLNKAFSACVSDRTSEESTSRKWGTYEIVGLVFRGYFKLRSLGLCRNILRAIGAADLPEFERFNRSQRVTFRYYTGVLAFLNEDYAKAESDLDYAFNQCHKDSFHNQELILRYLLPCKLLRGILPNHRFLSRFPKLASIYAGFVEAIRKGDVRSYDSQLALPETEKKLVKMGSYLAIERAREICLRGLLKRVYRCKDHNSRIALMDFHHALRFVGVDLELLETEWLVATQIAKGYLRGYISHSHMMAVLSAQNPFPKLNTVPNVLIS